MLRKDRKIPDGTIVVHCSAGVGRTGTFIATDIIMQKLKQEQKINIYDLVKKLREQRVKMVQSIEQYIFLYKLSMELVDAEIHRKKWKGKFKIFIFSNLRFKYFIFLSYKLHQSTH